MILATFKVRAGGWWGDQLIIPASQTLNARSDVNRATGKRTTVIDGTAARPEAAGEVLSDNGIGSLTQVSPTVRYMITPHVWSILGSRCSRRTQTYHYKLYIRVRQTAPTYFDVSQDVGLSFKSLNLLSICCVGP